MNYNSANLDYNAKLKLITFFRLGDLKISTYTVCAIWKQQISWNYPFELSDKIAIEISTVHIYAHKRLLVKEKYSLVNPKPIHMWRIQYIVSLLKRTWILNSFFMVIKRYKLLDIRVCSHSRQRIWHIYGTSCEESGMHIAQCTSKTQQAAKKRVDS